MIDQQEPQYAPLPPIAGGVGGPWSQWSLKGRLPMIRRSEDAHSPELVRHHAERDEAPGSRLSDPNVVPRESLWCTAGC